MERIDDSLEVSHSGTEKTYTAAQVITALNLPTQAVNVTGKRNDATALTNLLTALAGLGVITDSTTAS